MRATISRSRLLAIASLLALAGGCSSNKSNPASPGNVTAQDAADDVALQTVASAGVTAADLNAAVSTVPAGAAAPARALWDTTYTQGGLTFVATRNFYDAANHPLAGYDTSAVKMTWTSHITGTVQSQRDTATVIHRATIDVHGIQSGQDTLRFDGGVFDTLTNHFLSYDGTTRRYGYWKSYVTIDNVRLLKSMIAAGLAIPIGGTATFTVSLDRLRSNNILDVSSHVDATVILTFNGTTLADVVVNGTYRYKWNLVNGTVSRV